MGNHVIETTVAEHFATFLAGLELHALPEEVKAIATLDVIDAAGLCLAARNAPYMQQILASTEAPGACTVLGHRGSFGVQDAALANGVAIHGEDFDDTLEGAPIRVGAMVIPAALALSERFQCNGERTLLGITAGLEAVCRLNHVAAGHMHRAGFHPVGVIGALGAAAAAGVVLGLNRERLTAAFGIAASMSSGIIEYLTDGSWTKRLHPGWAAQSGVKAALIARTGFIAPRTVFDGAHNFFKAFAPTAQADYSHLTDGLGEHWYLSRIVFKPYACGTMIHPYIDCARQLRRDGIEAGDIKSIACDTSEGPVHRLWEPLTDKQQPSSGYAAKFSMPFCIALGFYEDDAGLSQFTDEKVQEAHLLELAKKISYRIDPDNQYPHNYSGHLEVTLLSGQVLTYNQPHMRGGVHEPLSHHEIIEKYFSNADHGGWAKDQAQALLNFCKSLGQAPNLGALVRFRG